MSRARRSISPRSVRCGLAIVRAAHHYACTVEERWGEKGFAVRVGINTGLVALGEVQHEIEARKGWDLDRRVEDVITRLELPGASELVTLSFTCS